MVFFTTTAVARRTGIAVVDEGGVLAEEQLYGIDYGNREGENNRFRSIDRVDGDF